jgi:hypothetical protein
VCSTSQFERFKDLANTKHNRKQNITENKKEKKRKEKKTNHNKLRKP